ncbi:MAG: DUF1738 domain-containing protein, partial [Thermoplasmata archaeon]|nr:DUF1738 domain-containing protein [Thermoplasmata archaeon]
MNKTYEVITDQIIGLLEKGTVPWRKPWTGGGLPRNINGRPYRGVNVFVLYGQEYSSPCWLTFNQAKKLGGNIKKGEKGIPVVFWKILKRLTDEVDEITGEPVVKQVPFLRYYTVFNLDQTDGIEAEQEMMPLTDTTPIKRTEDILDHMQHPPLVKHEGYRAFYSPIRDEIVLPEQKFFFSTEDYYSTRFHETIHWTGHNSRLNRKGITGFHMFGDKDYSQEE